MLFANAAVVTLVYRVTVCVLCVAEVFSNHAEGDEGGDTEEEYALPTIHESDEMGEALLYLSTLDSHVHDTTTHDMTHDTRHDTRHTA